MIRHVHFSKIVRSLHNFVNIPHLEPFLTIHMIIHCQYGCNQCVLWILVNASNESNKIIKLVLLDKNNLVKKRLERNKNII